jgi:ABC-2 type transport system permease protein
MIGTIVRIAWINLRRDRAGQVVSFLLPIAFFSIFALVFTGQGRDATSKISVAVVDQSGSPLNRRIVAALEKETGLRVRRAARPEGAAPDAAEQPLDRARAEQMVRDGDVPVAIILPEGLEISFVGESPAAIELLSDPSDPIAPQMVGGLLQKVAMTAAPDLMMKDGLDQFEQFAGAFTPEQRRVVDSWLPMLEERAAAGATPDTSDDAAFSGLVPVKVIDVLGQKRENPLVAFYAAGIGVMFLLFMCAGEGDSLLEEAESGTLDRLLATRLGMGRLLAGKWVSAALIGSLQIVIMFVWGALVFGLDLAGHVPGFALMTIATAAAASALGLVLATLCKSRAQLGGVSRIVILTMSALGGSMFPRFLMSEGMQKAGLLTFNAWALDGYVKVFWRDAPLVALWPQVLVLGGLTVVFLAIARMLARRWETV